MKGKLAFLLGAGVGYVLGARAGRERYVQIKRGVQSIWSADSVQQGVRVVREVVDEGADGVKDFARRAGGEAFSSVARTVRQATRGGGARSSGGSSTGASDASAGSARSADPEAPTGSSKAADSEDSTEDRSSK